jgi:TatA/E family protein of Tat protein translocase
MGAMFGIGPQELLVILVVGLLVLGPKRLPEIARSLGRGMAEFRRASSDLRQSLSLEDEPTRRAPPPRAPAQAGADTVEPAAGVPVGKPEGEAAASDPAEGRTIAPPPESGSGVPDASASPSPTNEKTPSGG